MKRTVSGIMLIFLLMAMFSLTFEIKPARGEWTGTVYIRADGSIDPPDAPIITYDNVTYFLMDDIQSPGDGIVIERSNIILEGGGYTVEGAIYAIEQPYMGIRLLADNVTIKDLKIQRFKFGIWLQVVQNIKLRNVRLVDNVYNFGVSGVFLAEYVHDIDSSNTVDGKPIYYWINESDRTVPVDAGYVALISCTRIIAQNLNLSKNYQGILLVLTKNSTISQNYLTNNWFGIHLLSSSTNNVNKNNLKSNLCGIFLESSSNNSLYENVFINDGLVVRNAYQNSVEKNIVNGKPLVYLEGMSNYRVGEAGQVVLVRCENIRVEGLNLSKTSFGIQLRETINCIISRNIITGNIHGIDLEYSAWNVIYRNQISNNDYGIWLYKTTGNSIFRNSITANNRYGILLNIYSCGNNIYANNITNNLCGIGVYFHSDGNKVYHNNFINNERHVICLLVHNDWNNSYPSGGNYWDDYTGEDHYSGPNQNEPGSDGIGDTPYVIDEFNIDYYPLMNPYIPPIPTPVIDITPQSLRLIGRGEWITAYIELPEDYCTSDINISTIKLNNTLSGASITIGDRDNDSIPDLMVKFDRQKVISYIMSNVDLERLYVERFMTITLTITGYFYDGTPFQGSDTIKIILPISISRYKIIPI